MPAYRTRDASARNLEVSTDAPSLPTVSIVSPTPRAFTFPINDTHFPTTPSSSPFEPTLKSIPSTPPPLRTFSPTSSIGSDSSLSVPDTLSVYSSPTAPAASQASSHRRRRSTASDIGERRPKKGDDDYIKRPENAFILFRRKCCEERQAAREEEESASGPVKKQRQADLSKTISQQWKSLSHEERQYWEDLAKEKKKEHEAMYPNYVYRPQRNKDKKGKKGKSRKDGDQDTDAESFSFLVPVSSSPSRSLSRDFGSGGHGHGHGRRAVSAPTPPAAFQPIQLPTVWMPSCPTSPRLIPRISGRSPAPPVANIPPPTESAPLTTFDYAPHDQLFMGNYAMHSLYDEHGNAYDANGEPINGTYQNDVYQIPDHAGMPGNHILHPLSIPRDPSCGMHSSVMSPAESIASSLLSPADSIASSILSPSETYASGTFSSGSSQGAPPFTPDDAIRMMSLSAPKDVPENVDPEADGSEMPFGFWPPTEALWANMESLMNEDFNLGAIPPVELGLAQFEPVPFTQATTASSPSSSGTIRPDSDHEREEFVQMSTEEHDFHDAPTSSATPGLDGFSGMYTYDSSTNW
ncbi:hypothetical protein C8Q73DRAFT_656285 [Cubamyces lactineus]|nr:hypothetical protein C8Q73DRAFT_656285 [Cubamyces lactineus]